MTDPAAFRTNAVAPPASIETIVAHVAEHRSEIDIRVEQLASVAQAAGDDHAHPQRADRGGADYGSEFDFVVARKFAERFTGIAKFASFESDGFARDTDRYSFEVNFAY